MIKKKHLRHYFPARRLKGRDGRAEKRPFHRAFRLLKRFSALRMGRQQGNRSSS